MCNATSIAKGEGREEERGQSTNKERKRQVCAIFSLKSADHRLNGILFSTKIAVEAQHGLITQVIKDVIFSMRPKNGGDSSAAAQVAEVTDMAIG
jgi:COP9 signalosome complex subunit 5